MEPIIFCPICSSINIRVKTKTEACGGLPEDTLRLICCDNCKVGLLVDLSWEYEAN